MENPHGGRSARELRSNPLLPMTNDNKSVLLTPFLASLKIGPVKTNYEVGLCRLQSLRRAQQQW